MLPVPPRPEPEQLDPATASAPASAPTPQPVAKEPTPTVGKPRGVRLRSKFVAIIAFALVAYGAWMYFRAPSGDPPNTSGVHSVRVWSQDDGDRREMASSAETNDPEAVEELLAVIRTARETREHKCGSVGVIHLRRSFGRVERLEYLPGHELSRYEFRYGGKIYCVPRAEFVAAMRRLGIEVPLDAPT